MSQEIQLQHFQNIQNSQSQQNELQQYQQNQQTKSQVTNGFRQFCLHLKLLLSKNYKIYKRQPCQQIFLALSPLLIIFMILFWQHIIDQLNNFEIIDGDIHQINNMQKCISGKGREEDDCLSIGYAVIGQKEAWIDYAMEHVAETNGLIMGKDIKMVVQGSPQEYYDYLSQNANYTNVGVIFCTTEWPVYENIMDLPCQFDKMQNFGKKMVFYSMVWNWTLTWKSPYLESQQTQFPKDDMLIRLKMSIDNALFEFFDKNDVKTASTVIEKEYDEQGQYTISKNQEYDQKIDLTHNYKEYQTITYQDYPSIQMRFQVGYDIATQNGAFYFFIPHMILFILSINEILQEKTKKLRMGISVMGMSHTAYWLSWFITSFVNTSLIVIVTIVLNYIAGFDMFVNTPWIILFVIYTTFGLNVQVLGYFITTICGDPKKGYTIAYGFLLLSIVVQLFFGVDWIIYYLYSAEANTLAVVTRVAFQFYPPFHLSKIYSDIAYVAGHHFSMAAGGWVEGNKYEYEMLFKENSGTMTLPSGNTTFDAPTTFESYLLMVMNLFIMIVLTWYCDHVFDGNRGTSDSLLFFLTPDYWSFLWRKKKNIHYQNKKINNHIDYNYDQIKKVDTVELERDRVLNNKMKKIEANGLRIIGLGKTYKKYPFGINSRYDVPALKDFNIELDQGELLAILGHNGSGKSTLINILTGLLTPTTGTSEIQNLDLRTDINQMRPLMGVCPQFDILWDRLTVEEHFKMFCQLKGLHKNQIEYEIKERLREVLLLQYRKAQIRTLSGGQKRRVSLAIAAIGNPQIVFMDEPTTGLDPKTRSSIWEMIKKLKINKSVILTTHDMKEADVLSDRIAVINEGKLQCIGTSLYLKNNYGDGYRLSLVCKPENIEYLRQKIKQIIPNCNIMDESGGNIVIIVPQSNLPEIQKFFRIVEGVEVDKESIQFTNLIEDWGLSHTTLEEVFLKITRKAKSTFQ